MSTTNYTADMTTRARTQPNSPAAGENAQSLRDFCRFDRRSVVLGLSASVIVVPGMMVVLALFRLSGWAGPVLGSLSYLALMALGVQANRQLAAAYDRREADRSEVSPG